eukprot:1243564-Pyramimonas_sp.AAC.2
MRSQCNLEAAMAARGARGAIGGPTAKAAVQARASAIAAAGGSGNDGSANAAVGRCWRQFHGLGGPRAADELSDVLAGTIQWTLKTQGGLDAAPHGAA